MPRPKSNLVGQKFGRLVVLQFVGKNKWRKTRWLCKCDCGKEKIIRGDHLISGSTKSCGCLQTKHGHSTTTTISKTYKSWDDIIQRCTNHNNPYYYCYGGRGITICERWRDAFVNFLEDMGEAPKGYQIDRINNEKGYYKGNCRWVTPKINNRNRRDNHIETFDGKTQCLSAWAEELNINRSTISERLKRGWSIDKTLTKPVQKQKKIST